MSEPFARTITHQGKDLRLSLPRNDPREHDNTLSDGVSRGLYQDLDIGSASQITAQTVEIFPDVGNVQNMRVVCSVSDRVQWAQKVQQVRERRLQELGVGTISNIAYRLPALATKSDRYVSPSYKVQDSNWTGLHTPAVSADSLHDFTSITSRRCLSLTGGALGDERAIQHANETLTAQIAALQAKHHSLSLSMTKLACEEPEAATDDVIPQRVLVHRRLNSITPVLVRNPSRIVSTIESITEEPEEEIHSASVADQDSPSGELLPVLGLDPYSLHQHLASHDMSELIRLQPPQYLPNFDHPYESFPWSDEPSQAEIQNFSDHIPVPYDAQVPDHLQTTPREIESPEFSQTSQSPVYFYPFDLANVVPAINDPLPRIGEIDYVNHAAHRSVYNTQAAEFVPFSQAVVRPSPVSQAIPIVDPAERAIIAAADVSSSAKVEEAEQTPQDSSVSDNAFDAYNGFDSGSEANSTVESDELDSTTSERSQSGDENDVRVKSFKFPSPVKSSARPTRPRSMLLNSESPEDRSKREFSGVSLPPILSSTPRKSPRSTLRRSVSMDDTELDSIIMDLSIRDRPARADSVNREADTEDSNMESSILFDDTGIRPSLRRVASAKLLLSHQDADIGLLLDAMLSAKLAGVTETLNTLQTAVATIEHCVVNMDSTSEKNSRKLIDLMQHSKYDQSTSMPPFSLECPETEGLADREKIRCDDTATDTASDVNVAHEEKLRITNAAKTALQKAVGDLTTKVARLEGQLFDSTTFSGVLQSQYSSSELSLTKLRKELNNVQAEKDQVSSRAEEIAEKYALLQQHMQDAAIQIATEQARWHQMNTEKDTLIEEIQDELRQHQLRCHGGRRGSSTSLNSYDPQITQFLMDRMKALEMSNQNLQSRQKEEMHTYQARFDGLTAEWRQMSTTLTQSECTVDGLRAELVMSTEFGDRLLEDLQRSQNVVDSLTVQLRKAGPTSILKRSRSENLLKDGSPAEQAILQLATQLSEKDKRIAELEALLRTPLDSTERQIQTAVSENIITEAINDDAYPIVMSNGCTAKSNGCAEHGISSAMVSETLKERVKELKRMRMSWEAKSPVLLANGASV